jgi:hypothetical protein
VTIGNATRGHRPASLTVVVTDVAEEERAVYGERMRVRPTTTCAAAALLAGQADGGLYSRRAATTWHRHGWKLRRAGHVAPTACSATAGAPSAMPS